MTLSILKDGGISCYTYALMEIKFITLFTKHIKMDKKMICVICQQEIKNNQPKFYFPKLPLNHYLSDISGVLHCFCLRKIDKSRKVGDGIADIIEYIAKNSEYSPFMIRRGNIVLCYSFDEDSIELSDYENFCKISIPMITVEKIKLLTSGKSILLLKGGAALYFGENSSLEVKCPYDDSSIDLPTLNLERLKILLEIGLENFKPQLLNGLYQQNFIGFRR